MVVRHPQLGVRARADNRHPAQLGGVDVICAQHMQHGIGRENRVKTVNLSVNILIHNVNVVIVRYPDLPGRELLATPGNASGAEPAFVGIAAIGVQLLNAHVISIIGASAPAAVVERVPDKHPPEVRAVGIPVNGDAARLPTVVSRIVIIAGHRPAAVTTGSRGNADGIISPGHVVAVVVLTIPNYGISAAPGANRAPRHADSAHRRGTGQDFNGRACRSGFIKDVADAEISPRKDGDVGHAAIDLDVGGIDIGLGGRGKRREGERERQPSGQGGTGQILQEGDHFKVSF